MSRSFIISLIIYGLLLGGIASIRGELLALALPFVVYLLTGFLRAPDAVRLDVARQLSTDRASPHSDVDVTVTLTNRGSSLEEVLLQDEVSRELTIRSGHVRHMLTLPRGASYTFNYTVAGPRGGFVFDRVWIRARDHLAVTSRTVQPGAKAQLFVFPPVLRLRHVAIRPRRTRVYAGSIPARAGGTGTEFFGVRDYQPGDPPRAINWRASGRHPDDLYSNEFQQERVADVGLVLDGRLRTNAFARGHSLFEHSVQAAAALSTALLTQGNRVGLLVYASFLRWTLPGYGKVQRERILHALAQARPGGSEVFSDLEHLPTRLFPRESQIILVSPLTDDDLMPLVQLRAQGYQVMVVSPDSIRFELSYLAHSPSVELAARVIRMERTLLLQKLQRAGMQVVDWDVAEPFDQIVKRRLSHPPAWLRAIGR